MWTPFARANVASSPTVERYAFSNVVFGTNEVGVLPAPQGSGMLPPPTLVLLPRNADGVSTPETNLMARALWSAWAICTPSSKMLKLAVMAVHGARRESPVTPGIARAASMLGRKKLSAVGVLTCSIAHVPLTAAGIAACATTPCETAAPRGSSATNASMPEARSARRAHRVWRGEVCGPDPRAKRRTNMETSMPAHV